MRLSVFLFLILLSGYADAQKNDSVWQRAFRITDYIVPLNDSIVLVQIRPGDGIQIAEKQLGVLRGVYQDSPSDTAMKGYGRCQLIKQDYYYFSIGHNSGKIPVKGGDLLYIFVPASPECKGLLPQLDLHRIVINDVYEHPFYDSLRILEYWSTADEQKVLDTMMRDVRFTAEYFIANQPSMNEAVTSGPYKGKKVLDVMLKATTAEISDFFEYIIARPRIYAGRNWKLSEIFATWIVNGAPRVVK